MMNSSLFDLSGQAALVTGGSGALGRALAEALIEAGARVAIVGLSERVEQTASDLGCIGLRADLANRAVRQRIFDEAMSALGQVDIFVAAHGIITRHKSEEYPLDEWDKILEVNLTSVFELCQLAGRSMLARQRGKIILVVSILSFSGGLTVPAYAAGKGGVAQITKALANEWAGRGVNERHCARLF